MAKPKHTQLLSIIPKLKRFPKVKILPKISFSSRLKTSKQHMKTRQCNKKHVFIRKTSITVLIRTAMCFRRHLLCQGKLSPERHNLS